MNTIEKQREKLFAGEEEAIKQALDAGGKFGYGNMIAHLKKAWAEQLLQNGLPLEAAVEAADTSAYPIDESTWRGYIPKERYNLLMKEGGELTYDEIRHGWHFCIEWDGLLIHPGMPEEACSCLKYRCTWCCIDVVSDPCPSCGNTSYDKSVSCKDHNWSRKHSTVWECKKCDRIKDLTDGKEYTVKEARAKGII